MLVVLWCLTARFTGLERGKDRFFQISAIGPDGVGPWSDAAMMMVV